MSELGNLVYYEVTLKFFVKYTTYDEVSESYYFNDKDEDEELSEGEFDELIEQTRTEMGSLRDKIMSMDKDDMFMCMCSFGDTVLDSCSWIVEGEETPDNLGLKVKFIIETGESVTIEDIEYDLLHNSLEDGPYEGFDNGWTFKTADGKYEYCLLDYRVKENITIKKCSAPH